MRSGPALYLKLSGCARTTTGFAQRTVLHHHTHEGRTTDLLVRLLPAPVQKDGEPGRYRTRGVEVTGAGGGPPAYVGPPAEEAPGLMREVVGWLSEDAAQTHLAVRAAMTHLNVVSMNPVRDGNGRISRIVQSLVLAIDVPRLPARPHECRTRAMNKAPPRVLASRPSR